MRLAIFVERKHTIELRYEYDLPTLQPIIIWDYCCKRKETKRRPNSTSQLRGVDVGK